MVARTYGDDASDAPEVSPVEGPSDLTALTRPDIDAYLCGEIDLDELRIRTWGPPVHSGYAGGRGEAGGADEDDIDVQFQRLAAAAHRPPCVRLRDLLREAGLPTEPGT